jgi:predicted nucleic acid-binding protein
MMGSTAMGSDRAVAIDATALIHFTKCGRLGALREIVEPQGRAVTTQAVLDEAMAIGGSVRASISSSAWLKVGDLSTLDEIRELARFTRLLGSGDRDIGEATILAWARLAGGVALVDDRKAHRIGSAHGVTVHGLLWFLRQAELDGTLDLADVRATIGDLAESGMYLPCGPRTYASWCKENETLLDAGADSPMVRRISKEIGEDPGA